MREDERGENRGEEEDSCGENGRASKEDGMADKRGQQESGSGNSDEDERAENRRQEGSSGEIEDREVSVPSA